MSVHSQSRDSFKIQSNLQIYFWVESVLVLAHLINHTPSPLLDNKSRSYLKFFMVLFRHIRSFIPFVVFVLLTIIKPKETNLLVKFEMCICWVSFCEKVLAIISS